MRKKPRAPYCIRFTDEQWARLNHIAAREGIPTSAVPSYLMRDDENREHIMGEPMWHRQATLEMWRTIERPEDGRYH